jgi:hypothetical protein
LSLHVALRAVLLVAGHRRAAHHDDKTTLNHT